ncbi:hypothetical protein C2I17_23720 [Niallia circulans]|nr:hypothetical protein C2I17_23720 [Niallia circulans]
MGDARKSETLQERMRRSGSALAPWKANPCSGNQYPIRRGHKKDHRQNLKFPGVCLQSDIPKCLFGMFLICS